MDAFSRDRGTLPDYAGIEADLTTQIGKIYLHEVTGQMFRIVGARRRYYVNGDNAWYYPVENVLTGAHSHFRRSALSLHPLNEMEVLAWATQSTR